VISGFWFLPSRRAAGTRNVRRGRRECVEVGISALALTGLLDVPGSYQLAQRGELDLTPPVDVLVDVRLRHWLQLLAQVGNDGRSGVAGSDLFRSAKVGPVAHAAELQHEGLRGCELALDA